MAKLFLTGATGYIGGDFLHAIAKAHPELAITVLVRQESAASKLKQEYPRVDVIQGDLNDSETLVKAGSGADVILNLAATSHLPSLKAFHEGASSKKSSHIIQISGATMVSQDEIKAKNFGNATDDQYSDVRDEKQLQGIIRKHQNRTVDNYILDIAEKTPDVKAALVIPSLIYGKGRGPGNQRSIQVPELTRIALERKRAVQIGAGANIWSNIHVSDVSAILVALVESAISGSNDKSIWGANGLFFAGADAGVSFGAVAKKIAEAAQKSSLLPTGDVDEISASEADALSPHASAIVGTNARTLSERAQKLLGWSAKGHSLEQEIPLTVAAEAQRLKSNL
ncbi:hypothetical protein Q7P37_011390 [Cladosporium fusiforme]